MADAKLITLILLISLILKSQKILRSPINFFEKNALKIVFLTFLMSVFTRAKFEEIV